ncbi:hypothetical protein NECAME_15530 [Necator americanus]|uniref:Uncharacterized protein n=1 Tax=Necator americanus TaxID=51031 RepID=W2SK24_NECAM|nr:hypothetical protein NECAME_15530 [Necator americanus]ETN69097.1 hypothetical protein NECAME_15530 [Necator americanus]
MYQWALFFLMLAFCRLGNLQEAPACPDNGEFTLNIIIRKQLYERISMLQPSLVSLWNAYLFLRGDDICIIYGIYSTNSRFKKYDCGLESMGGLVLGDPNKNMEVVNSKKVLTYYVFGQNGANLERAIRLFVGKYRNEITKLEKEEKFGCNYINAHDKHQFICIFVKEMFCIILQNKSDFNPN